MKKFLIVVGIIFVGYKFVNYKFIKAQENRFMELPTIEMEESQRYFHDSLKLSNSDFWALIDNSKAEHPNNFDAQMSFLKKQLSVLPNEQIIGFERTLREKVIELWNYDIKSLYQILYGEYISTDVFIYFRFWIVSNGKDFFQTALENTDELAGTIDINEDGESLLYVADEAFVIKNGTKSGIELPRDQSYDIDYDIGNYKMTGQYVDPKNFDDNYPKLTDKY